MEQTYSVIKVSDRLLVVVDKEASLSDHDIVVNIENKAQPQVYKCVLLKGIYKTRFKVIATIYDSIEGVPRIEIPDTEITEEIKQAARDSATENDLPKSAAFYIGFLKGYKATKANGCYADTLLKALDIIKKECEESNVRQYTCINGWGYSQLERNIAERILNLTAQQPKEIESVTLGDYDPSVNSITPIKVTYK